MTARRKIDVHARTLSMEFGDKLVQFNIFEAMKHPTKDHSLFSIDVMDELVEEYMQIGTGNADFSNFVKIPNVIDYFNSVEDLSNSINMSHIQDFLDSEDNIADLADVLKWPESDSRDKKEAETNSNIQEEDETDSTNLEEAETDSNIQEEVEIDLHNLEEAKTDSKSQLEVRSDSNNSKSMQAKAESISRQPSPHSDRVGQSILTSANQFSPPYSQPTKLKPLPDHLKYAYMDDHQHFPVIIANNLNQE
ncbi:hypothetical protein CR513_22215, partial [Mucuna pruriens]